MRRENLIRLIMSALFLFVLTTSVWASEGVAPTTEPVMAEAGMTPAQAERSEASQAFAEQGRNAVAFAMTFRVGEEGQPLPRIDPIDETPFEEFPMDPDANTGPSHPGPEGYEEECSPGEEPELDENGNILPKPEPQPDPPVSPPVSSPPMPVDENGNPVGESNFEDEPIEVPLDLDDIPILVPLDEQDIQEPNPKPPRKEDRTIFQNIIEMKIREELYGKGEIF